MQHVGLHVRLADTIDSVVEVAFLLELPIFQLFFKNEHGYLPINEDIIKKFLALRDSFDSLYAHSSYIINIADPTIEYHPALKREIYRAQKLAFTHLVLHPGSMTEKSSRTESLDTVVRRLNLLVKNEPEISFVLENSAHGKKALGGDIEELIYIRSRLDKPEKVSLCIDTAHAHVFGYDIREPGWLEWMCSLVSSEAISLIHLNDTKEQRGSCIDRHCVIGEGELKGTLNQWVNHPLLRDKPIILELPALEMDEQKRILKEVRSWKTS